MKLISLILIPAMLAGQNVQLSDAARKLLSKPRFGDAQLTLVDGRKETGVILRVTVQSIVFEKNRNPADCEDVELSKIAAVRWLPNPWHTNVGPEIANAIVIGPVVAFFMAANAIGYVVFAIADPFQRIAPPLKPPRGEWVSGSSKMMFYDSTVRYEGVTVKRGRYSVKEDMLYLKPDGGPETAVPFRFDYYGLELDSARGKLNLWGTSYRATAPVVGEWKCAGYWLNLRPDASFEERTSGPRKGTFERTAAGLKIRWSDGQDSIAQIRRRHIVITDGGVTATYHYVPEGFCGVL